MKWILSNADTWHAWQQGAHTTVCGRIGAEHLQRFPAKAICDDRDLTLDRKCCTSCLRKTGASARAADPVSAAWVGLIKLHSCHIHARVHEKLIIQLAQKLAEVGPPSSPEGREAFECVKLVLLRPLRDRRQDARGHVRSFATFPHLKHALDLLTPGSLSRVVSTVRIWRNATRGDLSRAKFRPDNVIETILALPSPEPYINHMRSRGLDAFALLFHPNTLARARKDTGLRGLFGGSTEYWSTATQQLNIVAD